jgi:hypothetical protein
MIDPDKRVHFTSDAMKQARPANQDRLDCHALRRVYVLSLIDNSHCALAERCQNSI